MNIITCFIDRGPRLVIQTVTNNFPDLDSYLPLFFMQGAPSLAPRYAGNVIPQASTEIHANAQ